MKLKSQNRRKRKTLTPRDPAQPPLLWFTWLSVSRVRPEEGAGPALSPDEPDA